MKKKNLVVVMMLVLCSQVMSTAMTPALVSEVAYFAQATASDLIKAAKKFAPNDFRKKIDTLLYKSDGTLRQVCFDENEQWFKVSGKWVSEADNQNLITALQKLSKEKASKLQDIITQADLEGAFYDSNMAAEAAVSSSSLDLNSVAENGAQLLLEAGTKKIQPEELLALQKGLSLPDEVIDATIKHLQAQDAQKPKVVVFRDPFTGKWAPKKLEQETRARYEQYIKDHKSSKTERLKSFMSDHAQLIIAGAVILPVLGTIAYNYYQLQQLLKTQEAPVDNAIQDEGSSIAMPKEEELVTLGSDASDNVTNKISKKDIGIVGRLIDSLPVGSGIFVGSAAYDYVTTPSLQKLAEIYLYDEQESDAKVRLQNFQQALHRYGYDAPKYKSKVDAILEKAGF